MKCDKERVTHWLNNQLTEPERELFERHLAECTACREEVDTTRKTLSQLSKIVVPEPSDKMDVRFQAMLDMYQQSVGEKQRYGERVRDFLYQNLLLRPRFQWTYTVLLLIVGITAGYLIADKNAPNTGRQEMAKLSSQVEEMLQIMALALLENPSASDRLRAVNYTGEMSHVNNQVISALLTTFNEDPNVNVRLVTLEALARYSDIPAVREGLIQSIVFQESPLVQSALADVMLKLQEKKAIESFRKLLQGKGIKNPVKIKIEQTIHKLTL